MRFKFLPLLCLLLGAVLVPGRSISQNACVKDTFFHIVVLGSSTAAGSGASPSDSSWVNRYRDYLQGLNPGYQLTNLAVGGYSTYRIMPTGFATPANRPTVDTLRNITAAIALNPSAIIVNLPSNDVSQGFSVQEQMDNWDTVWTHAQNASIPIWICTTQPKNYGGNMTNIQKQVDVRDSIWARYSPRVLDFWTGLNSPTNELDPTYDSGDGTHLNNLGHYTLFTRARNENIPAQLYVPPPYVDATPLTVTPMFAPPCGDSMAVYEITLINRGQADNQPLPYSWSLQSLGGGMNQSGNGTTASTLASCEDTAVPLVLQTADGGDYELQVITQSLADGNLTNDTLTYTFSTLGLPALTAQSDTGCGTSQLLLSATSQPGDSFRWYDAAVGGNLLGAGTQFTTPPISSTTSYFVEALRGEFFFRNSLATTQNNNINWNGTMFDLVADSALVLDSFALKVTSAGAQDVVVRTRNGTHLGYETNAGAWTTLGSFPVTVTNTDSFVTIGPLNIALGAGDSLGVYLSLANSASTLGYQSMGQPALRATDELQIITGSGASFNFGGNFYPRDWNGEVFYHFGTKPDGDCQSDRVAVEAVISNPALFLGNDTILNVTSSITLDAGAGFATYQWSNGQGGQTITLDGTQLGTGVYPITVQALDANGCPASDTIIVVFAPLVSTQAPQAAQLTAWPNPATDALNVFLPAGEWEVELVDGWGRVVGKWEMDGLQTESLSLDQMANGLYWLVAKGNERLNRPIIIYR